MDTDTDIVIDTDTDKGTHTNPDTDLNPDLNPDLDPDLDADTNFHSSDVYQSFLMCMRICVCGREDMQHLRVHRDLHTYKEAT